ncbi:MAG: helix-turn-helix domain-containing protein [Kiritimatiellia bacterium]|nr:helix-turn-helix domain-containing protein [Kiritimatiellia bacterium]
MQQDIGKVFREARERKNVTVSQAAEATRIKAAYIEAMEQNTFGVFAAPIYARGFIRTYSEYLGVDSNPLVDAYQAGSAPQPPAASAPVPPPRTRTAPTAVTKRPVPAFNAPEPAASAPVASKPISRTELPIPSEPKNDLPDRTEDEPVPEAPAEPIRSDYARTPYPAPFRKPDFLTGNLAPVLSGIGVAVLLLLALVRCTHRAAAPSPDPVPPPPPSAEPILMELPPEPFLSIPPLQPSK